MLSNIFSHIPADLPEELFETLAFADDIKIERIVSRGHATPKGEWYDQDWDEWVLLLQGHANISYQDGNKAGLKKGDFILIPAHKKHRVDFTSSQPDAIWLAIHFKPQKIN